MHDYSASLQLNGAQLIQQPLWDHDNNLIEPWKAPFIITKGALVAVEARLFVYHFMAGLRPSHVSSLLHTSSVVYL